MDSHLPLLGFVAWSGTGKTTLLERLIPLLDRRGLRLGVLKHSHHEFDTDQPGKDSHRLRKAGAQQVMAASSLRHARIVETPDGATPFADLLAGFDWSRLDLLLIEGFKHEHFPKIALHRAAIGRPPMFAGDPDIVALVSDHQQETHLPRFAFDELPAIADFICARLTAPDAPSHAPQPHAAPLPGGPLAGQPLRLIALAMADIPCQGECLPGHVSQDAAGVLQVRPAGATHAANCLIELAPGRPVIARGGRVWIKPLQ